MGTVYHRVTVAVAGFGENELSIEAKENTLTIKGSKEAKEDQNGEVLYQGIAARAFERVFQLAEHVLVKNASLENGLLHVDLVREIPEAKKPRQIPIGNGQAKARVVETKAAATRKRIVDGAPDSGRFCLSGAAPVPPRRSPGPPVTQWHCAIVASVVLFLLAKCAAAKGKDSPIPAWTSLVWRGKIWHGPLGQ